MHIIQHRDIRRGARAKTQEGLLKQPYKLFIGWAGMKASTRAFHDQLCVPVQLLRDVKAFLSAIVREEGRIDAVVLASKLAAVGYHLTIRTALGGGAGRSCFHNLHHEFLLVMGDPEFGTPQDKEFIVDPHFR